MKYCEAVYQTKRRPTRVVMVGHVGLGGSHPIRIQSMTTSNTRDIEATLHQVIRLADAGCEIVRLTVQGMKEAEACEAIKSGLIQRGYDIPLVADIHFYPPAAMRVVDFVDKVRINPGNFVDKRASFKVIEYDDDSYAQELVKIEEKFSPLVEKCKKLKRAMRIGTNHGSLSDRIMNRFGDTPVGMVESALEFARICRKMEYHDIVFSMKASNPQVMIQAYRLLAAAMYELDWDYPLHLGVTEAGEGEDGRVKSAMGIGSLLLDGIGDTIRISLTEDPWLEIDPCRRLICLAKEKENRGISPFVENYRSIGQFQKREIRFDSPLPLHRNGTVFLTASEDEASASDFYHQIGCEGSFGRPKLQSMTADNLFFERCPSGERSSRILPDLKEIGLGLFSKNFSPLTIPIVSLEERFKMKALKEKTGRFAYVPFDDQEEPCPIEIKEGEVIDWDRLAQLNPPLIILSASANRLHYCRQFFNLIQEYHIQSPIILRFHYQCPEEDLVLLAAMECGALLCDGLAEGIWLEGAYPLTVLRQLSFSILQAARMRMSKTDFISCPSCGRTLFDLQDVTKRIQKRTSHLPGVKIAIMGCIVNGPGEMADADFGYVGSKPGKIDLYVGKECVERDINFSEADDRLVDLIKAHGCWREPSEVENY
ncbi:MAG: (E)-4-hydroxy-3-methylbut-2-enyl-diphosphate synthase [Parachlamydiaceae bacterium]